MIRRLITPTTTILSSKSSTASAKVRLLTSTKFNTKFCSFATETSSTTERTINREGIQDRLPKNISLAEEFLPNDCTQEDIAKSLQEHYEWHTPVILRNVVTDSTACQKWKNLDYLVEAVGEDVFCEVEIGKGYNDPHMTKSRIPFEEYIQYIRLFENLYGKQDKQRHKNDDTTNLPKPEEMIYLAQNEMFKGLESDFVVPHFCSDASYGIGAGSLHHTMVWLGPHGTVTPLHYDPLDNLLMQMVGSKRVVLYPPMNSASSSSEPNFSNAYDSYNNDDDDNNCYYAGVNGEQYNTSPINIEDPDYEKYPNFKNAPPGMEGTLHRGDMLFIPKKWWHHIRSLETSMSVNSWWR